MKKDAQATLSNVSSKIKETAKEAGLGWLIPPTDSITDTGAPNALPGLVDSAVGLALTAVLVTVVLIPVGALAVVEFVVKGPPHKDMDLRTLVTSRILWWVLYFRFQLKFPGLDKGEASFKKWMVRKGSCVEQIVIPPCEDKYVIGWARHDLVKPLPRPGFMVWPKKDEYPYHPAPGFQPARPFEKIVIYFVGGGYVSGHPLTSALAFKISEMLDCRVFCE